MGKGGADTRVATARSQLRIRKPHGLVDRTSEGDAVCHEYQPAALVRTREETVNEYQACLA